MFFASYKDASGKEHANLYFNHEQFYKDTFSPECEILQVIVFSISGKNYQERKQYLEELAIDYSNAWYDMDSLSYGEFAIITDFFERNGKRYGLLTEFKENAII